MYKIITGFFSNSKSILPLTERSETFGENRLAVNAIDWQDFIVMAVREDWID